MKVIVENSLNNTKRVNGIVCLEFTGICNLIAQSQNEVELRANFKKFGGNLIHFVYGFGSNHIWVHQVVDGVVNDKRIIYAKF